MLKTKAYQFRGIETFSKTVLSYILIKENETLLEIHVDHGNNLGKWERAKIKTLICVDPEKDQIKEVEKKHSHRKSTFQIELFHSSPLSDLKISKKVQNAFCFSGIDQYFTSYDIASDLLCNISKMIEKGGYFCGMFFDAETIFHRLQEVETNKEDQVIINGGKLYNLTIPIYFQTFGTKIKLEIAEEDSPIIQYLIHTPSFIKISKIAGFEVISMANLHQFYDDYKDLYEELLLQLQVFRNKETKIDQYQMELVDMFMIFILRKL